MDSLEFLIRTGKVVIDLDRCQGCETFGCVKACALFGTNLYRIENNLPALVFDPEETQRRCNECLGCEYACHQYGRGALRIELNMFGLVAREEGASGNPG